VLDLVAPGGPSTYTVDSFRVAMSVQYIVWVVGIVQIVRFRRKARTAGPPGKPAPDAVEPPVAAGSHRQLS
jgi:hypothetical protein